MDANVECDEASASVTHGNMPSARSEEVGITRDSSATDANTHNLAFETMVCTGSALYDRAIRVAGLRRRDSYQTLKAYLQRGPADRVRLLCGLRRSGKTTMMLQAIADMTPEERACIAFIDIMPLNDFRQLSRDVFRLQEAGYENVFVDEVTLLSDFIENASLFSDVFATEGMRVVLAGDDSLGLWLASLDALYDRAVFIRMTYVPFREHVRLLGRVDIEEYLECGGTLCTPEKDGSGTYSLDGGDGVGFATEESMRCYVDTAIVRNIEHSLSFQSRVSHFPHLRNLLSTGELPDVINRAIEDIIYTFMADVLRHRLSCITLDLDCLGARDREDTKDVTTWLTEMLNVLEDGGRKATVTDVIAVEIREWMEALDLLASVPVEAATGGTVDRVIFTQLGLCYALAKALVHTLMEGPILAGMGSRTRKLVGDMVLADVRERMLADIVLFETVRVLPAHQEAFRLEFATGRYDMVIYDEVSDTCDVFEVDYGLARHSAQRRFLLDDACVTACEHVVAPINKRVVLYRGEPGWKDGISYVNVTNYLLGLTRRSRLR